jgi:hypothetical protein
VSTSIQLVLAAILVLQFKHFIDDFVLQTPHPGGFLHAGIHAVGSMFAFLFIQPTLIVGIAVVVLEFIAHYHIDWLKERTTRVRQWSFPQSEFWWTFGADQAAHQATYVVIAGVLAWSAGL